MVDFLAVLGRRWRIVLAVVLLGIGASAGITRELTPIYESRAQVFVALDSGGSAAELSSVANFSTQRVKSYADLVDSPLVLGPVIEDLGLEQTATQLQDRIRGDVAPGTVLISVYVEDESPELAAAIANAVAGQLTEVVEDRDRTSSASESPVRLSVTRNAVPAITPKSPIPALNLAVGLLIGLSVGLSLAWLREALDTTLKDDVDVSEASGLPTLAQVPTNDEIQDAPLIHRNSGNPVWAESYRKLRTNLSYVDPDNPAKVIVLASALSGDGKSITAANLASSVAQSGKRTILVEADLRRPSLGRVLGLPADVGVTSVVSGKVALADVIQHAEPFDAIMSGPIPPNPSELLGSQAFAQVIAALRAEYDFDDIANPPLMAVTHAAVSTVIADAVVVVAKAKRTKRADLRRALFGLRAVDAHIAGVVLNQVSSSNMASYRYEYTPRTR